MTEILSLQKTLCCSVIIFLDCNSSHKTSFLLETDDIRIILLLFPYTIEKFPTPYIFSLQGLLKELVINLQNYICLKALTSGVAQDQKITLIISNIFTKKLIF